ncbi:MAG: PhzF family phenazine biosynthesis protein, partial [Candidatus Dormibacteraeota bacterium]|nr:PhzF family phenazine biosynthesis protein [Candidatus Dormibacteraeota bacterium]
MAPYVVVDVFTETPLEGNPLAVFTDGSGIPPERMQRIAREMNLSETVFVLPPGSGGDHRIRIFTPFTELPFAGHPTLGTAYVVGSASEAGAVTLETGAGAVEVGFTRAGGRIRSGRMTQPIPTWEPFEEPAGVLAALGGAVPVLPVEVYRNGPAHVYVALAREEDVASLQPDLGALARLWDGGIYCFAGSGAHRRA